MFFSQRKPKSFNYKPIYTKDSNEVEEGLKENMLNVWNRESYQDALKLGQRRIKRLVLIGLVLSLSIFWLLYYFNAL